MPDEPHADDETISPTDVLWRRVPNDPNFIIFDKKLGRNRVASSAFDNDRDGDPMSVYLASETTIEAVLHGNEGKGVVAFTAGFARGQGQIVFRSPDDSEGVPGHAKVQGEKSRQVRNAFVAVARWIRRPTPYDEVSLPDPPDTTDG